MIDVCLVAFKLDNAFILKKTIHADSAVKSLSEKELTEWNPLESAVVTPTSDLVSVYTSNDTHAHQANRQVDSEGAQEEEAADPHGI